MKLQDIDIDGTIFKVQEGISFVQRNNLMELLEEFIDFTKLESIQEEINDDKLTIEKFKGVLNEGVKLTTFNFKLIEFCLITFVNEPKITPAMLNDPDDDNTENFAVLGSELVKLALNYISTQSLLKKTPTI